MTAQFAASVIIPTHDRARLLEACLEHVLSLHLPGERYEVIVVENACTDGTVEVVRAAQARHPQVPLQEIHEPELGASAARNAGIRVARGRVLCFTEDDAYPAAEWLHAMLTAYRNPRVSSAGGPIELVFSVTPPAWFSPPLLPYLGAFDLGTESIPMTYNEYPRGGNMSFRQEVFAEIGLFSTSFGRVGRSLRTGEEIELGWRLEQQGRAAVYIPGARVFHRIDADRLIHEWFLDRFMWQGRSEAHFDRLHRGWQEIWRRMRTEARWLMSPTRAYMTPEWRFYHICRRRTAFGYFAGLAAASCIQTIGFWRKIHRPLSRFP